MMSRAERIEQSNWRDRSIFQQEYNLMKSWSSGIYPSILS